MDFLLFHFLQHLFNVGSVNCMAYAEHKKLLFTLNISPSSIYEQGWLQEAHEHCNTYFKNKWAQSQYHKVNISGPVQFHPYFILASSEDWNVVYSQMSCQFFSSLLSTETSYPSTLENCTTWKKTLWITCPRLHISHHDELRTSVSPAVLELWQ